MTVPACFVGIDVAKATLDVAVRPTGERWSAPNDEAGIGALVAQLRPLAPVRPANAALCGQRGTCDPYPAFSRARIFVPESGPPNAALM